MQIHDLDDETRREQVLRRCTRTLAAWTEVASDEMIYHLEGTCENPIDLEGVTTNQNAPT